MAKNVKSSQHNLKIIRRFEEDIWGVLATSNKPSRVLNYLFEVYKNNYKYKRLLKRKSFFLVKKQDKFLYQVANDDKEFRRKKRTIKINNYLNMLKLRRFYGNLRLKQFKRVFKERSLDSNVMGRSFVYFLESRLDVILYRANFFSSIYAARQFINHKKVYINGQIVNKPGYNVFVNDIITLSNYADLYLKLQSRLKDDLILVNYPKYLEVNYKLGSIIFSRLPEHTEVPFPFFMNLNNLTHNFTR